MELMDPTEKDVQLDQSEGFLSLLSCTFEAELKIQLCHEMKALLVCNQVKRASSNLNVDSNPPRRNGVSADFFNVLPTLDLAWES